MVDIVQTLARAARAGGGTSLGRVLSVDVAAGTVQAQVGTAPVTAYLTDQTLSTVTVGCTAVLLPVGQTLSVLATMNGTALAPNLLPNGDFSLPGDGQIPGGWVIHQDGSAALQWYADATAGPDGGFAGVLTVYSMGTNQSLSVVNSPNFTVDAGVTYRLTFSTKCDATVTNCIVWPSLQCYTTTDTWWGQNITNGVLSPNVGNEWGEPYTTDLTVPAGANRAYVNLGIFCDTASTGGIYLADVALRRAA